MTVERPLTAADIWWIAIQKGDADYYDENGVRVTAIKTVDTRIILFWSRDGAGPIYDLVNRLDLQKMPRIITTAMEGWAIGGIFNRTLAEGEEDMIARVITGIISLHHEDLSELDFVRDHLVEMAEQLKDRNAQEIASIVRHWMMNDRGPRRGYT